MLVNGAIDEREIVSFSTWIPNWSHQASHGRCWGSCPKVWSNLSHSNADVGEGTVWQTTSLSMERNIPCISTKKTFRLANILSTEKEILAQEHHFPSYYTFSIYCIHIFYNSNLSLLFKSEQAGTWYWCYAKRPAIQDRWRCRSVRNWSCGYSWTIEH